jgi:hypothetical protein
MQRGISAIRLVGGATWTFATGAARASALLRVLDVDLASRFRDSKSVNDALRMLIALEVTLAR